VLDMISLHDRRQSSKRLLLLLTSVGKMFHSMLSAVRKHSEPIFEADASPSHAQSPRPGSKI
jgi:hypothetical protein